MKNSALLLILFAATFSTSVVHAVCMDSAESTIGSLSVLHQELDQFKKECGRFPTTEEGLFALGNLPPGVECAKRTKFIGLRL
jgi:hypothetical protein